MPCMSEEDIVATLTMAEGGHRVDILKSLLDAFGVQHVTESDDVGGDNVIVRFGGSGKALTLVAHHDVVSGSKGINDNACAVAMLLRLAWRLKDASVTTPVTILFPDREEKGALGSDAWLRRHRDECDSAIVFDIIGYGDRHVYGTHHPDVFRSLGLLGLSRITTVLPSDNLAFRRHGVPSVLVTAIHADDFVLVDDAYGIVPEPRFYTSFHGGIHDDDMSVIDFRLIHSLNDKLVSLLTAHDHDRFRPDEETREVDR
jgi:Zn-dependent M28 family amino/carboxypeptidase